jgi:hypothetical protein
MMLIPSAIDVIRDDICQREGHFRNLTSQRLA